MIKNDDIRCKHPAKNKQKEKKVINNLTVEVEICTLCGQEVIKPEDAQKILTHRGDKDFQFNPSDIIIALLGSFPERPIINRIVMMKEAFLFEKELARDIDLNVESLQFIPYNFGPYSKVIDDSIRELEYEGIIKIEREAYGQKEIIQLTEKGKSIANAFFKSLSEEVIKYIKRKRKAWDQLGYYGILRKVYEEYPAYRSKSEISDEIKPSRRWV